jgi:PAS domain S-box-containing protein
MNDVVWMANLDFALTYISPSVKKILGFTPEERIRQTPAEMMTAETLFNAFNILNRELEREHEEGVDPERTVKVEMDFYHKNGSIVRMESVMSAIRDHDGTITGIHGVSRDITERKQAEEEKKKLEAQLTQVQKLESIGTLAGGIAHDFNNILAAIIGYTELAMNDISEPTKAWGELKEVRKAGDRAKSLVSQILAFSRQTETKHSPLTLQPIIKESIKMMRSVIPTTIEIRQNLVDSGLVMSDPTQINQIVMNLCTNAVHAMDWTGGVLEVSLKRVSINGDAKTPDLDLPPGRYVKLSVSDTGQGMTPEVMARIFDPYFTTKEVGRGTGLGLSVVHGIVKSHGGVITCRSTYGEGSVFDIYLPEIDTKDESSNPHLERVLLPIGTESILFVDDEPVLIELAKKMIENLGYTVLTRTSSIEALELFRNNPSKFDLVITDMTMPAMTGDKLAQRMMEIRQDIPIILCTGYSEYITEERAKRIGIREFVMKPLVVKELSKTIRKVLDER